MGPIRHVLAASMGLPLSFISNTSGFPGRYDDGQHAKQVVPVEQHLGRLEAAHVVREVTVERRRFDERALLAVDEPVDVARVHVAQHGAQRAAARPRHLGDGVVHGAAPLAHPREQVGLSHGQRSGRGST